MQVKKIEKEGVKDASGKVHRTLWIFYQVLGWNNKCLEKYRWQWFLWFMFFFCHSDQVLLPCWSTKAPSTSIVLKNPLRPICTLSNPTYHSILSYPILFYSYLILSYPLLSYPILDYPILSYLIISYPIPADWILFSYDARLLLSSLSLILPVSVSKSVQSVFAVRVGRTHTGNHTSSRSLAWQRKSRESVEEKKRKKWRRKGER